MAMRSTILIGLFFFVLSCVGVASAKSLPLPSFMQMAQQAGAPDSTFGHGGKVATGVVGIPTDARIQIDGRIDVVAGPGVVRFLPNGAIDASFGRGGVASVGFSAVALAIQSDGKLVVAGSIVDTYGTPIEAAAARLTQNGQLDRGFGHNGVVAIDFVGTNISKGEGVILQPDGRIIVSGFARFGVCRRTTFTSLARLTQNGSLDVSFGSGGIVAESNVFGATINSLALQSTGKILVLGDSTSAARFLPNGTRDSSVTGGTITSIAHVGASSFQPDGRIITGGNAFDDYGYDWDMQAQRFWRTGAVDTSFRSPDIDFGPTAPSNQVVVDSASAIAFESNGRIIIGGISQAPDYSSKFGLARFDSNGSLDATFGGGGRLTTGFFQHAWVTALAVQSDGKIIAVGTSSGAASNAPNYLVLARYMGP